MVAGDILRSRAQPWLSANGRDALRILAPMPVLGVVWWVRSLSLGSNAWLSLCGYALVNLAVLLLLRYPQLRQSSSWRRRLFSVAALSDGLIALLLLVTAGPVNGVVFVLCFVLALKVLLYQRLFQWVLLVPMLIGPSYLAALVFTPERLQPRSSTTWAVFALLLLGSAGSSAISLWSSISRQREQKRRLLQLEAERQGFQSRIVELDSVTNDLRAHIRSQQALEESLRAVTGSLSLDDVLRQILDSTMQMLRPERVDGAALTLRTGDSLTHHLLKLDTHLPDCWAELLAQSVVREQSTLLVNDATGEQQWLQLAQCGAVSAMSVPLVADDGKIMGALSVVSRQTHAFSLAEARHLNSFGIQACVSIRNAELHSQLRSQWAMLEAVLRDLGDGLVVYDEAGDIVLTNPVARRVLMDGSEKALAMQAQIEQLVADVQQGSGRMMWCELQGATDDEQSEQVYQAFASPARVSDASDSHVAVVLHDITSHKAEERARTEFVSMVSHELRNPLHTLGGFLKVVLQGRAGALTSLQHEFLHTAEEQVEKLNGRINELLEFNRLDAGRLRVEREWSDLPILAAATTAALALQAEQTGLTLINQVPNDLPELLMDSKRIGQVLTNLIENAIKATPPTGTIRLTAEVQDGLVRMCVSDTGVGIAESDIRKIFDPFYGRSSRSALYGAHLGLGLSICQQIIEGHGGRIWVESQEGAGSMFSFTLPIVEREQALELAAA